MPNLYLEQASETSGPFTRRELKELAAQGKISPQDQIRCGKFGMEIKASEVSGLLPALKPGSQRSRSDGTDSPESPVDLEHESSPFLTTAQKEWIVIICGTVFMGGLLLFPLFQALLKLLNIL